VSTFVPKFVIKEVVSKVVIANAVKQSKKIIYWLSNRLLRSFLLRKDAKRLLRQPLLVVYRNVSA